MALELVYSNGPVNVDTDGSVNGGNKGDQYYQPQVAYGGYGLKYPADVIHGFVTPGEKGTNYLGCFGIIRDNKKQKNVAAICFDSAGGTRGPNYWNEVSIKVGATFGYSFEEFNGAYAPAAVDGSFSIWVDKSYKPDLSSCNGDYNKIQPLLDKIASERYGKDWQVVEGSTAFGAATSGDYSSSFGGMITQDQIKVDYLQHKVMVLSRKSPDVNFDKAKENNVSAVMVEAGFLYDTNRKEVDSYKNPKVRKQCVSANDADIPFGLWCESRAKTEEEALKEIYQLSFVIRNYPPVLGMWIHFNWYTSKKKTNDKIVKVYQREMKRLGLLKRIGIIASKKELEKISWSETHYENWILWLVEHVSDASKVDGLLDPSMFTIGSSIQLDVSRGGSILGQGNTTSGTSTIIGNVGNLATSDLGNSIIAEARTHFGAPFIMGATGPNSFDCSGFTQYVYNKCGISIPRVADAQWTSSNHLTKPRVGDLIFFQGTYDTPGASHVGIVSGESTMIHAGSSTGIVETSFQIDYYQKHFLGFGTYMK